MISEIRQLGVAPGAERINLPGELELLEEERRSRAGIPLSPQVLGELTELARRLETPSVTGLSALASAADDSD